MRNPGTNDGKKPFVSGSLASILAAPAAIAGILSLVVAIVGILIEAGAFRTGQPKESPPGNPTTPAAVAPTSQQEIEAWNNALAHRDDCDSLRTYVLDYPAGHFVSAAQTILTARREIMEGRWVAFEFPSNVVASSSLESRTSREAACLSAREQIMANMVDGCGVFKRQPSRYRNVTVLPPLNSSCECQDEAIHLDDQMTDPLWRCSIRATYSCRGEQLQQVKRFVCN